MSLDPSYRSDPSNGVNAILEDVAIASFGHTSHARRYTRLAPAPGPNASVRVQTSRSGMPHSVQTNIKGALRYVFFPSLNGTWGEMYYASPCVTSAGDSGAPVEDANGELIGHVIAGGDYMYIQDADYQLRQISQKSSFHGNLAL